MKIIPIKVRKSNWEIVAFLLIYDSIKNLPKTGKYFNRSGLMSTKNLNKAVNWLKDLNHKRFPEHPEATLQRTIQNLRDKGFIIFHGDGEYELTATGVEECQRVAKALKVEERSIAEIIDEIQNKYKEADYEKFKEILESSGLPQEQIKDVLENYRKL